MYCSPFVKFEISWNHEYEFGDKTDNEINGSAFPNPNSYFGKPDVARSYAYKL